VTFNFIYGSGSQYWSSAARSALQAAATRLGARKIFLEVAEDNAAALALYLGAGYSEIGRGAGYYRRADRPAVAALVLEKPLPPA